MTHPGLCGRRVRCYRQECRARFDPYPSVELLPSGHVVYHCHRLVVRDEIDRAILAASQ